MTNHGKLSFVSRYGIIKLLPEKEQYLFRAYPDRDSPVLQMTDKSRWNLIDTLYELIKSLN